MSGSKKIIGVVEDVTIIGKKAKTLSARIDTGATRSSIDESLVKELGLGPIKSSKLVKSALGNHVRPVIDVTFKLGGEKIHADFTVADRSHMRFPILIGRTAMTGRFLVDPDKGGLN